MIGARRKVACKLAQRAEKAVIEASSGKPDRGAPGALSRFSAHSAAPSRNSQPNTCGLASQCGLVAAIIGGANNPTSRKSPPAAKCSLLHIQEEAAIAAENSAATPPRPPARCANPISASEPHSHANQGSPLLENE